MEKFTHGRIRINANALKLLRKKSIKPRAVSTSLLRAKACSVGFIYQKS